MCTSHWHCTTDKEWGQAKNKVQQAEINLQGKLEEWNMRIISYRESLGRKWLKLRNMGIWDGQEFRHAKFQAYMKWDSRQKFLYTIISHWALVALMFCSIFHCIYLHFGYHFLIMNKFPNPHSGMYTLNQDGVCS